jgi:hypothetical protein
MAVKKRFILTILSAVVLLTGRQLRAGDLDADPIHYSTAATDNAVSRLERRLETRQARLVYEPQRGYLASLLSALQVPLSSQVLVFSKTSLQRHRIGPERPRAIYFNDEVYVGYCQHGDLIEVSAVDPQLGAVFYSLPQRAAEMPRFPRQQDTCLICHSSSQNQGLPGHLVRSVHPDAEGLPILSLGTQHIDHTSPLLDRWGGWYVTGTSGKQLHLGNRTEQPEAPSPSVPRLADINLPSLKGRCDTSPYLSPHSDIVALMILEHQTEMHNRITRAGFLTRMVLYEEVEINKALGRPPGERSESTLSRIKNAGEPLLKYLLFCGETRLTDPIRGTSGFAEEFSRHGPRDPLGRSLYDLDLQHRLFRYPASYLIYSSAFDALPEPVRNYVLQRLWDVLASKDSSPEFAHLSAADRQAIREILIATKPNLPDYWRTSPVSTREPR